MQENLSPAYNRVFFLALKIVTAEKSTPLERVLNYNQINSIQPVRGGMAPAAIEWILMPFQSSGHPLIYTI